jgi:hypothetical protein
MSTINNTNAEKWTIEKVTEHLLAIGRDAYNADTIYLGRALVNQNLYADVWRYWKKIFRNNSDVIEAMKQIEQHFEVKLFEGAVRKELSPWVAIFALKNNHGWDSKREPDPDEQRSEAIVQLDKDTIMYIQTNKDNEIYQRVPREIKQLDGAKE